MVTVFTIIAVLQVLAGYVCARGIYCITKMTWLSVAIVLLAITAPLSFGALRNSLKCTWLMDLICNIGHIYMGFILYFSICCAVTFVVCKFNAGMNVQKILSFELGGVFLLLFAGYINAMNPTLKEIDVPSDISLKICFVSDIHVGSINTLRTLNKVAELVEHANPDVVILGGDTIDQRGISNYSKEFIEIMQKVSSKYETFAVVGNHEIYTGAQDCVNLLKRAGISVLLDSCVALEDVVIAGRLDKTVYRRKSLQEIIPEYVKNLIVVDHEPDSVDESAENGAILQLSGHTHAGQMFPMNLVINLMYKPTGELGKTGDTYFYITTGAGFWGPPYRIGNRPEVVSIKLGNQIHRNVRENNAKAPINLD